MFLCRSSDLQSGSACFVNLTQRCRHLKKLFLTANRSLWCSVFVSALGNADIVLLLRPQFVPTSVLSKQAWLTSNFNTVCRLVSVRFPTFFREISRPVWHRGTPLPLVLNPNPHLFPFLLFSFFHWLYLFSSFVHPFPFYQNSPTLFPDRRS